ncbi:antitoxin Xre/MbcA/ParS toxin-binding domain-containing protein [Marinihelvus fidelis]|uniref:antitoxin Xre/MbcA/ParS toxin-binding domain-containing protein n=1 Tax=Marinihelvus fidelis TaxID=2613842 RepID=UPI001CD267FC|nr:antitoxin Xre/MbcA/ParS toxin-binding domain-containing protein [Marinihelvus fidelis]
MYVDGYNFYYGCLKGTSFKWLDLVKLFEEQILPSILIPNQSNPPVLAFHDPAVKFFTAKIIERAARSTDSVSSQARYHTALRKTHGQRLELIEGYYAINEAKAKLIDAEDPKKWPRDCSEAPYWKLEEKQSDVNLALNLYHDALTGEIDHAVVVTNDTDVAPAMKFVRSNTNVIVGLIVPSCDNTRKPNTALTDLAHWVRRSVTEKELLKSQLPRVVQGGKRPTSKPVSWYPRPDLLKPALELATQVLGTKVKAFKWLGERNERFNGETPLGLLESNAGARKVMKYMGTYIENIAKD